MARGKKDIRMTKIFCQGENSMPAYSFVSFPAPGVNSGMDNVLHSAANYVIGKFPRRVIRAHFVVPGIRCGIFKRKVRKGLRRDNHEVYLPGSRLHAA
jgi:hypothetical protein